MNRKWVIEAIEQVAKYGKQERGIYRLAFTQADFDCRNYVSELMRQVGMTVRVDQTGNIIGRIEGSKANAAAVITGSHLDTVPSGGKYDGVVGVIGGIAAIQKLKERGLLSHPIEVIVFAAEESSRFSYATIGSKAMAGAGNLAAWRKAKDGDGITLKEAMDGAGLNLELMRESVRKTDEIKGFVELHIEQGRMLQDDKVKIGIVDTIASSTRLKITVDGTAGHSGTTPMDERNDALVHAAMVILAIREIALEKTDRSTVATIGALKVHPGAINVIPEQVELWVDIRSVDHESVIECLQEIKDAISTIAEEQETSIAIEMLSSEKPVKMDRAVMGIIEDSCKRAGLSYMKLSSGAGHDAMNMARLTPTGMIFIPCANGISHNPDEYADLDDIMHGIDILADTLYEMAK